MRSLRTPFAHIDAREQHCHCTAGSYAQWVTIQEKHVALIPDNVSFEQAAASLASLTAWQVYHIAPMAMIHLHFIQVSCMRFSCKLQDANEQVTERMAVRTC